MNYKPIILVGGEPYSIFFEIFFKILNKKNYKSPIILIASKNLLIKQMKKMNFNFKLNELKKDNIDFKSLKKKKN